MAHTDAAVASNGLWRPVASGGPVATILDQHREDAAILWNVRSQLVRAPHVRLHHLRRIDERVDAHLDGLAVAARKGWRIASDRPRQAEAEAEAGEVFAAAVLALQQPDGSERFGRLLALAEASQACRPGLISALGWTSAQSLQGVARQALDSANPFHCAVGLAACAAHRVDPGVALAAALGSSDGLLRARALRVVGEVGRRDLLGRCLDGLTDDNEEVRFQAARSALLLGDTAACVDVLLQLALRPGPRRAGALESVLKVIPLGLAKDLLQALAGQSRAQRELIRGMGVAGDPRYVPWLIQQMHDMQLARVAGEAASLVMDLDLAWLDLERKPPDGFESGPDDDPENPDVAMDEDEGLPWPDPEKIAISWEADHQRFPAGTRFFMGQPVNAANCRRVLRHGFQRQRIAAADYLCLLQPGTPVFPTSAPAWRQERWLGATDA